MAKSQKRSTRELRKPKADKGKAPVALAAIEKSPVKLIAREPKGKH